MSRIGRSGAALAVVLLGAVASASDIHDLQRDLPLDVEDTTTADKGSWQLQASGRFEETDNHQGLFDLEPQVQYGLTEEVQLELSYPIFVGDADRTGSGDVRLGALYRFLDEGSPGFGSDPWPSLAVRGEVALPTGVNSDGFDTLLRFVATKTLTTAPSQDRVHFNVEWEHNAAAGGDERQNRFAGILGYSRKLDDETVVLADLVRQQETEEGQDSTIIEAGFLRQLTDKLSIGAGVGLGLGDDSPEYRLTIGVQYSF